MGEDDRLAMFGERLARIEARQESMPSNGDLISTAGSSGKLAAREYMDGLTESFQKETQRRLERLERMMEQIRGRVIILGAVLLAVGIVIGQQIPPLMP